MNNSWLGQNGEIAKDAAAKASTDAAQQWRKFLTPETPSDFLSGWLTLTAMRIVHCRSAILFVRANDRQLGIGAGWNLDDNTRSAFEAAGGEVAKSAEVYVSPTGEGVVAGAPIIIDGLVQAIVLVMLDRHPGSALREVMRELHWSSGWIEAQLLRGRSAIGGRQQETARMVLDLLAAADSHARIEGAAMAVVNALPSITPFDQAALGMMRGGRLKLQALSRTAHFKRKADHVREIENAMSEMIAQGIPVVLPRTGEGLGPVDLAHRMLQTRTGAASLVSLPLLVRGKAEGALLLIRKSEDGSDEAAPADAVVEDLRLAAASIAPVLKLKHDERRWISGRARDLGGRAASAILGRRPAITLLAATLVTLLAGSVLLTGPYRISADATLEGAEQRVVVAPTDGYLVEAPRRAGDVVEAGDLLALLDDRDLKIEESGYVADVRKADQKIRDALASGDRLASARANAELQEARASLDLTREKLRRLEIRAPSGGMIVSGDLTQRLGAPLSQGDQLFEIARLDGYRLLIDVSEYDLAAVRVGETGTAVLTSLSHADVGFEVTAIASISDPAEGENRFRVEAAVTENVDGMRPGMEGVAKIDAGEARYIWLWTHGTIDRLRLLLWKFLP